MAQGTDLKRRIRSGETVIGASASMQLDLAGLKSLVAKGPYDFVSVDGQHSPVNEDRLVSFCTMAAEAGVHVQFRIKHTRHAYLVGNYLDLGPSGVEVPQVETEETVDEAVRNFYYPQTGIRSWGGAARVGLNDHSDRLEYAPWWNEYGVLWMQIESVEATTNARRFAKPGVDCLSFGPMDLSFSLEAHRNSPFKTVDECAGYVIEQLKGTDVTLAFRVPTYDERRKYIDMGARVILVQKP